MGLFSNTRETSDGKGPIDSRSWTDCSWRDKTEQEKKEEREGDRACKIGRNENFHQVLIHATPHEKISPGFLRDQASSDWDTCF